MLKVVFEAKNFIALDKPSGVLTVPSRMGKSDPRRCLGIELQEKRGQVFPVHRLDFEVSGLVIFALNADTHRELNRAFEQHRVQKTYAALTSGEQPKDWSIGETRVWKSKMLRGKKRAYHADYGDPAITEVTYLGSVNVGGHEVLSWRLSPVTGRSHQLRLEMAAHGWPIWGDELYGSPLKISDGGIALRAEVIEFDPKTTAAVEGLPPRLEATSLIEHLS